LRHLRGRLVDVGKRRANVEGKRTIVVDLGSKAIELDSIALVDGIDGGTTVGGGLDLDLDLVLVGLSDCDFSAIL
jgi:hypothetical protein